MAFLGDNGGWYVEDTNTDGLSGPFETLEEAEQCACDIMGVEYVALKKGDENWIRVTEWSKKFSDAGIEIYRIGGKHRGEENWKKDEFYR